MWKTILYSLRWQNEDENIVCNFFKDALIKRAVALILELHWDSKKNMDKFQYESIKRIIEKSLKYPNKMETRAKLNTEITVKQTQINENYIKQPNFL